MFLHTRLTIHTKSGKSYIRDIKNVFCEDESMKETMENEINNTMDVAKERELLTYRDEDCGLVKIYTSEIEGWTIRSHITKKYY